MNQWRRAVHAVTCGYCLDVILPGQPVYLITLSRVSRPKRRCQQCAGELPPEDLQDEGPTRMVLSFAPDVEPMAHIASVRSDLTARLVGSE